MVFPSGHAAFHLCENIFSGINHQEIFHVGVVAYSMNSERQLNTKALKMLITAQITYVDQCFIHSFSVQYQPLQCLSIFSRSAL